MGVKSVIILSGGFDPLHSGHIEMFKQAKEQYDYVAVCLNSDEWLKKKKGTNFLSFDERKGILESIKYVDFVFGFEDDEKGSAVNGIKEVIKYFNFVIDVDYDSYELETHTQKFYFGNGGDRNVKTTPSEEQKFCEENGIVMVWNVGGGKNNSSSYLLNRYRDWHFEMTDRPWGNYKVVYQDSNKKVKVIEVEPHRSLSLQSHSMRSEHWVVVEGTAVVYIETDKYKHEEIIRCNESIYVPIGAKHKLYNKTDQMLQIVEVQIGDYLGEDDIIRYD